MVTEDRFTDTTIARQGQGRPMAAKHYTAQQIAAIKGCSARTVRRWAAEHNLGTRLTPRMWLFSEAEKRQILAAVIGSVGNPNFGKNKKTEE